MKQSELVMSFLSQKINVCVIGTFTEMTYDSAQITQKNSCQKALHFMDSFTSIFPHQEKELTINR